jgi:FkbM family methyltransferase
MNRLTEPYWLAWLRWHAGRKRKAHRKYAAMWRFRRLVRTLPPGGIAIDCGANVGDATALFLAAGQTVHAFEPDPEARAVLERRFAANPRLVIHPQAVGATAGRATLHRRPAAGAGGLAHTRSSSLLAQARHRDGAAVEVEVADLLAFLAGLDAPVAVLKLDVEGAEADILDRLLDERRDRAIGHIFVETHEKFSDDMRARIEAIRGRVATLGIANLELDWQ